MKAVIFLLSVERAQVDDAVRKIVNAGTFASRIPKQWRAMYSTFADCATLSNGDLVFFFSHRRLYGILRLAGDPRTGSAVFVTHPNALRCERQTFDSRNPSPVVGKGARDSQERLYVGVDPQPSLFIDGIDMDDLLADAEANSASGLRTLSGRSFFVVGDLEARWLERKFLARAAEASEESYSPAKKGRHLAEIERGEATSYFVSDIVFANPKFVESNGRIGNESILHGLVIDEIKRQHEPILCPPSRFGLLDVYHEFAASPVKPAEYQDRIDVLAVSGSKSLQQAGRGIPSFFDLYEIKKGTLGEEDTLSACNQLMKYVDFVAHTMAGGSYAPLRATVVARGFSGDMERFLKNLALRGYMTLSRTGPRNRTWAEFRLVTYEWTGSLVLSTVLELTSSPDIA